MSRKSTGGSNTLLNYFTKSPSVAVKRKSPEREEKNVKPPPDNGCESEEENIPVTSKRKRIRLLSKESDESDVENTGNGIDTTNTSLKLNDSFKYVCKSPSAANKSLKNNKNMSNNENNLDTSTSEDPKPIGVPSDDGDWLHCRLDWLKPENIRDSKKRRPDHPEYDPKTLFVPQDFLATQTAAHRQWWEMKASHYDCVLFFKVGKFYELYHMDAAVGVNELGFSYMKGQFAHSGFPESAYGRMVSSLVQKGYRVARVEQTETPEMMQERMKKTNVPSKSKVVRREICQISSKGTEVCGLQDNGPINSASDYMMAIAEYDIGGGRSKYGLCFLDTSIGTFNLGQFDDDRHSSRLLTTLAHNPPCLVLVERGVLTERTKKLLKSSCHSVRMEHLTHSQFWTANHTLKTLAQKYYQNNSVTEWPAGIKTVQSEVDPLGLTPKDSYELAVRALGACVWYLTDCLIDVQILGMSQFKIYTPPDDYEPFDVKKQSSLPNNMVLDSSTLSNLHVIGENQSLLSRLDHCVTPMGKRLLHQWVCAPSCVVKTIKERQGAISYFLDNPTVVQNVKGILNGLPDIERLFSKIHCLGNLKRSKDHPDARAILYEEKTYSKRKVLDFISLLNGFGSALDALTEFKNCHSELLKRITQIEPLGSFPDIAETLQFFKGAFDHKLAEKEGTILPGKGVDKEYDGTLEEILNIESESEDYLKSQERRFNCRVTYFGSDKKRYQLEVPESKSNKAGHDYSLEGARKGFKRYSTSETREFLMRILTAEENKRTVLKDLSRKIFEKFSQSHALWQKAISCISVLDVLLSLSEYVRLHGSGDTCVPQIDIADEGTQPFIKIKDGRHPCIPSSVDFIPNDTNLNANGEASLVLLTGPNMGGKSTLMRQLGLLTIMAQIGCHVPAAECHINIVDRIFTRLGARDDIMAGQSTFLVELSETSAILKHTTRHSLVLLDELGRGTSTYDGTAIAAAVVDELSKRGCRTMFSTHYHTLVEDFKHNDNVSLGHMACMVETEESDENEELFTQETVTFLYKFSKGACPKSYGFNAARLAGVSKEITRRAHQIATRMEEEAQLVTLFKNLYKKVGKVTKEHVMDVLQRKQI